MSISNIEALQDTLAERAANNYCASQDGACVDKPIAEWCSPCIISGCARLLANRFHIRGRPWSLNDTLSALEDAAEHLIGEHECHHALAERTKSAGLAARAFAAFAVTQPRERIPMKLRPSTLHELSQVSLVPTTGPECAIGITPPEARAIITAYRAPQWPDPGAPAPAEKPPLGEIVDLANSINGKLKDLLADARPLDEWSDEDGPVLWWSFPVVEPPYVGWPSSSDWPGYHTHWTRIVVPDQKAHPQEECPDLREPALSVEKLREGGDAWRAIEEVCYGIAYDERSASRTLPREYPKLSEVSINATSAIIGIVRAALSGSAAKPVEGNDGNV